MFIHLVFFLNRFTCITYWFVKGDIKGINLFVLWYLIVFLIMALFYAYNNF